jgi:hypothetical protein
MHPSIDRGRQARVQDRRASDTRAYAASMPPYDCPALSLVVLRECHPVHPVPSALKP